MRALCCGPRCPAPRRRHPQAFAFYIGLAMLFEDMWGREVSRGRGAWQGRGLRGRVWASEALDNRGATLERSCFCSFPTYTSS